MSNGQYEMRVGKTSYSPKNVTGIKWEEQDSGLLFRKQIVQEYDGKQMPLSSYSRCMPWELSQEQESLIDDIYSRKKKLAFSTHSM